MVKGGDIKNTLKGHLRLLSGRKIKSPIGQTARPTTARVREALMNILGSKVKDSNWLDLFSGSGVIGCEAIQHGARKVLAIERNKKVADICQDNLITTALGRPENIHVEVRCNEVISFLSKDDSIFRVV